MGNENFQKEVTKRLDVIIRLLAATSMKEDTLTERIYFFNKAGCSPKEISEILNTTSNYVNVILSNLRKKEKKREVSETKPSEEIASIGNDGGV